MLVRKNDHKGNQVCASNHCRQNKAHTTFFHLADAIKYIIRTKIMSAKDKKTQFRFFFNNDLPREDYIHARRVVITFIFATKIDNDDVLSLIFFHTYQRYCRMGCQKLNRGMWAARCQVDRHRCLHFQFLKLLVTSLMETLHNICGLSTRQVLRAHLRSLDIAIQA